MGNRILIVKIKNFCKPNTYKAVQLANNRPNNCMVYFNFNNIDLSSIVVYYGPPGQFLALHLRGQAENGPGRSIIAIMPSRPILFPH